jgi:hypothetical protein
MIYSNDEADKSVRQKNFYLSVYVLPIAVIAIICGLVYSASKANYLGRTDLSYGYIFSLTPAFFLYIFNRRNWLKMPDGTYHNIKGISQTTTVNLNEPTEYEAEYFNSKKQKISTLLSGLLMVGVAIWLAIRGGRTILLPIIAIFFGVFLSYAGIKGLLDKTAKLKLAKTGLWTNKLGFVVWKNVTKAQVVENRSGRTPETILEIYLKGTVFAEANQPDERLYLTDIENKGMIETVLVTLMQKHNEVQD